MLPLQLNIQYVLPQQERHIKQNRKVVLFSVPLVFILCFTFSFFCNFSIWSTVWSVSKTTKMWWTVTSSVCKKHPATKTLYQKFLATITSQLAMDPTEEWVFLSKTLCSKMKTLRVSLREMKNLHSFWYCLFHPSMWSLFTEPTYAKDHKLKNNLSTLFLISLKKSFSL